MPKIVRELNKQRFFQMEALEKRFYSPAYITPANESYEHYLKYPLSTVAAIEGANVVGFVNMFPVVQSVFNDIMHGAYNDSALTCDDIMDVETGGDIPFHMFLSCIVVDSAHRKQGVTRALLCAAACNYAGIKERCDYIVTDNVTADGRRFSQRMGFELVCKSDHGSFIYAMPYCKFVENTLCL